MTNKEINDIIRIIKCLENRGILLKRPTAKVTSREGGFLNFVRPLMTAVLPLMKNVLKQLATSVLLPFTFRSIISATDAKFLDQVQRH